MKFSRLILTAAILAGLLPFASGGEVPSRPLRFAFITDLHYGSPRNVADIKACIADINAQDSIDFVLMGGDLTNFGSDWQIREAKKALDELKPKYWVVAGNHDAKWSESGSNTFLRTFGYEQFEFEAGGWRFLGCNSGPEMRHGPALVPRESVNWIKGLQKGAPVIFLNHYPLTSAMSNWFEIRRELLRLDCRLAVSGHVHRNGKRDYQGLPGFTGRAVIRGKGVPGYNIVTLRDGKVRVAERRLFGDSAVTLEPWYEQTLLPVQDTLRYDADGFPEHYKLGTYAGNSRYPQVKTRWKIAEDANIGSGFATDGRTAWYATTAGKVCAVSLGDGARLWSRVFPGKIFSTPALGGKTLVFACTDGNVYALDAASGRTLWQYGMEKASVAAPAILGKTVFVGGSDGRFRALRLKDGKLLWEKEVKGFCDARPYVDKDHVIFGTWGRKLYCMHPRTGAELWTRTYRLHVSEMFSPGGCTPVRCGDRLYVSLPDRRTYCLDLQSGDTLFWLDDGWSLTSDGRTVYVKNLFGRLVALDGRVPLSRAVDTPSAQSPSRKYKRPGAPLLGPSEYLYKTAIGLGAKDPSPSEPALLGPWVLVPSQNGNVHALDAGTGRPLWVRKVGIGLVNPLSVWEEKDKRCVLASTMDGVIELFEIQK